jgi:hypothetical protein
VTATTASISLSQFVTSFGTVAAGAVVVGTITPVVYSQVFASGDNTFPVPAGAVGCWVSPASTNTHVLKFRTVGGDTGDDIPQASPFIHLFDPANLPTNVIINAAAAAGVGGVIMF